MNQNPYSTPSSSVVDPIDPERLELHEPRMVGAGHGVAWVSESFELFKKNPGMWILVCVVLIVISLIFGALSTVLPYIALVTGVFNYVWVGGLMIGTKAQDQGQDLSVGHLFAGFSNQFGALIGLGLLITIASHIIGFATFGNNYFAITGATNDPEQTAEFYTMIFQDPIQSFLLPFLIGLLFYIPLVMVAWFVPALVIFHNVPFAKAMSMSFVGCIKNFIPFLVNGIVFAALFGLSAFTLFLGCLVLIPMTFVSIYCAYKDIFVKVD